MNTPLISVITPTFNSGEKIIRTVDSVLSQEPGLYEYLVVDGGSTDGSLAHIQARGPALRWLSEPDGGIYDAMNKGVRLAAGRFLYFLGAGDRLRPGALRAVADMVPPAGALNLLYGDVHWPERGGTYGGPFNAYRLVRQNICHQAIFYERGIFDLLKGYDLRYKICADHALNVRCFGNPLVRTTHLDLVIADYEGGGISDNRDTPFFTDFPALAWRHLGPVAALKVRYHHSAAFAWARWLTARLGFYFQRPWSALPSRVLQRLRRTRLRAR